MQTEIKNSVEDVKGATGNQRAKIIAETSKKLTGISNSFTGDLTKNAATTLGGKLNSGLKRKYTEVYTLVLLATKNTSIAKKAGTAAQTAMLGPVAKLQKNYLAS